MCKDSLSKMLLPIHLVHDLQEVRNRTTTVTVTVTTAAAAVAATATTAIMAAVLLVVVSTTMVLIPTTMGCLEMIVSHFPTGGIWPIVLKKTTIILRGKKTVSSVCA